MSPLRKSDPGVLAHNAVFEQCRNPILRLREGNQEGHTWPLVWPVQLLQVPEAWTCIHLHGHHGKAQAPHNTPVKTEEFAGPVEQKNTLASR